MLKGKNILLGVTGSIAAYKAADLASLLTKANANVTVIMTNAAKHFITPETFETLTKNRCYDDVFDREDPSRVSHIDLAKNCDVFIIAPASANTIAKLSNGFADNMLTSTFLAYTGRTIISPAMNTNMYNHKATKNNLSTLKDMGVFLIEPATGKLACKDIGKGKLPDTEVLFEAVLKEASKEKPLKGKKVLITAGPTKELIDPVRFISNNSTGKMGYACARAALRLGADVTVVTGPTSIKKPSFVNVVEVTSAFEMNKEVMSLASDSDIIICSAAVSDYTPASYSEEKIKKNSDFSLPLNKTNDILFTLGQEKKENQKLIGFAMETSNLIENAKKKLEKKNLDLICANNLFDEGAGFGVDTNKMTFLTKTSIKSIPVLSKDLMAEKIIEEIINL